MVQCIRTNFNNLTYDNNIINLKKIYSNVVSDFLKSYNRKSFRNQSHNYFDPYG